MPARGGVASASVPPVRRPCLRTTENDQVQPQPKLYTSFQYANGWDAATGQAHELCSPRSDRLLTLLPRRIPSPPFGPAPPPGRHPSASSLQSPCSGATSARPTELGPLHARVRAAPQPKTRTVCLQLSGKRGAASRPPHLFVAAAASHTAGSCCQQMHALHSSVWARTDIYIYPSFDASDCRGPCVCAVNSLCHGRKTPLSWLGWASAGTPRLSRRSWRRRQRRTRVATGRRNNILLPARCSWPSACQAPRGLLGRVGTESADVRLRPAEQQEQQRKRTTVLQ